ncbi:MAG: AMP-binding protein, partial [Planctomycetota bacterium]
LDRVWGSIFSWAGERFVKKVPRRIPYPVTVSFGEAVESGTPLEDLRRRVHELSEAAWFYRKKDRLPLHREFIRNARRSPWTLAFADVTLPGVSRVKALAGAIAFARALRTHWEGQERVGLLLPPTVAGALANIAASISGRTSVNLNYTAGASGMESAARQSELKTVLTSRAFLEKGKIDLPQGVEPIYLEDVRETIGRGDRIGAFFRALFQPAKWLERSCGATGRISVDDIVTVIFSSGSTGEPKGVELSHFNVDSNVEALAQIMRVNPRDRLLGILPLFHSFGYMSLWFGSNQGVGVVFHPNPLDAAAVGELVQRYRLTILIATPTFLQIYMRRCTPAQFGSLRLVLTGAEKLPERVALAFEDYFGIRPLEGYGTTECAPAIAASALDYRAPGFYQSGSRRGTVGQPLPGVSVRIVDPEEDFDPETSEVRPAGESGMLVVRGPNVMRGYLGKDELNAKVLKDGWYVTCDIAVLDDDGFLRITDRLSRFSKIAGEMVPHGRVEEALHDALGSELQVFAVTAVPDEKKGEKLAVLTTVSDDEVPGVLEKLGGMGLPNLFVPRPDQFVRVDELPMLGTGKLDLRRAKQIAEEALTASS